MSWLAPKMKHRLQILQAVQEPDPDKFYIPRTYKTLVRLWCKIEIFNKDSIFQGLSIIRGQSISDQITHVFTVRWNSVISKTARAMGDGFGGDYSSYSTQGLNKEFDIAFGDGFDSIIDMDPIKSDYFVLLEDGQRNRGRLFRIQKIIRDDNNKEYVLIKCSPVEEKGSGYQE